MKKNQANNVQYVDFKSKSVLIVPEKQIKTKCKTIKVAKKVEKDINPIHRYIKNEDLKSLATKKKNFSLHLIEYETNKELHKKAIKAIIQTVKSNRKFKPDAH